MNATFKTIKSSIFNRIVKLTSHMEKNTKMKIDKRYPGQANAFMKASLDPKIFPSLKQIWMQAGAPKLFNDAEQENRSGGGRNTYFYVIFSKI